MEEKCSCGRKKERAEAEVKKLTNRLNRLEGQIRGIKGMVEKDVYCPDILVQVAAASAALNAFAKELLAEHIRTCVVNDIQNGQNETTEELITVVHKLMR